MRQHKNRGSDSQLSDSAWGISVDGYVCFLFFCPLSPVVGKSIIFGVYDYHLGKDETY